jgi:hypothetical protein
MYHYKTRFILREPTDGYLWKHLSGYYPDKNFTKDISYDYYDKRTNWPIQNVANINRLIDSQIRQLPEYLRSNVVPIGLIKRTLVDVTNFFRKYLKGNLNILKYFLFCLDLMENLNKYTKKDKLIYFRDKIKEHLNLTDVQVDTEIVLHEFYKTTKKSHGLYQKLYGIKQTICEILYNYIVDECIILFESDSLNCLHKHVMLYCDNCDKLTFHLREWNNIMINGELLSTDKCITTTRGDIKFEEYESDYYKNTVIKLCDFTDCSAGRWLVNLSDEYKIIKWYQCFNCSNKTNCLKIKKNHKILKREGCTAYFDFPVNMKEIKEEMVKFSQSQIIKQINYNLYIYVKNNYFLLLGFYLSDDIDEIIKKYL